MEGVGEERGGGEAKPKQNESSVCVSAKQQAVELSRGCHGHGAAFDRSRRSVSIQLALRAVRKAERA